MGMADADTMAAQRLLSTYFVEKLLNSAAISRS
jgi:hypothetical protein